MSGKGFYGRFAGERRPKHKVYCILMKGGYVYFPVAAQKAPYLDKNGVRQGSFLAGMPNFFGGNVKESEDVYTALAREIREESQGHIMIEIPRRALEELLSKTGENQDTYQFYLVRIENRGVVQFDFEEGTVFELQQYDEHNEAAREHPECYEDSFLVRIEEARFRTFVQELFDAQNIDDEEARKAQVARIFIEHDINWTATVTSIHNWYGSHTAMGFSII